MRVRTETLDRFLGAVGEVILSSSQLRTAAVHFEQRAEVSAGIDQVERRVAELSRQLVAMHELYGQRREDSHAVELAAVEHHLREAGVVESARYETTAATEESRLAQVGRRSALGAESSL